MTDNRDDGRREIIDKCDECGWVGKPLIDRGGVHRCGVCGGCAIVENCGATDSEAGEVGRKSVFDDLADCIPGGMDEGEVRLCDHFHRSAWQAATKRERERLLRKLDEDPDERCGPVAAAIRGEK